MGKYMTNPPTTEPGRDETQEYVLRAMAANYTSGGTLDHLDLEVFTKAADEIKRLRARLSTPDDQAVREADATCYLERSEVRKILTGQPDESLYITEQVLADIDALPILTADDIRDRCSRKAHKVMTSEEYAAMPIIGWHEVCRDVDGFGAIGIRFLGETRSLTTEPKRS